MYQKDKSSFSKVKFRQANNRCKRVLGAAKLAYANKAKEFITSQKLGFQEFWQIANSILNKGKSTIPPLFNGPEVLSSASDQITLRKTFLRTPILMTQVYLIELLGLSTGLLELWYLIYPRLLTGFSMLIFFTNLSLTEFHVGYLTLFPLFSVIDGFEWFWMESLHKNIQLMLEFLKGSFLVLHFSCCILMTFLMMLSVILLSMLMTLPSILSVFRHLICVNNLNQLLNLNLIYETL